MTDHHKRLHVWAIAAIFGLVSIWWTFYFPYSREGLYRAIPRNALIVGEHPELGGRWTTCLKTPLVRGILNAQGITDQQIEKVVADPRVGRAIEAFAGRNTVIAYVPALDTSRRPAWLFASWAGIYGQPLRWGWTARKMKDFDRIRLGQGRSGWRLKPGKLKGDMQLSLATSEGILLGCLSEDPTGVGYILDRIDSKLPLAATVMTMVNEVPGPSPAEKAGAQGQVDGFPTDRVWFEWRRMRAAAGARKARALLGVTLHGEAGAEGWFKADFLPELPATAAVGQGDASAVQRLLGDVPDAAAIAPFDLVCALVPDSAAWAEAGTVAATIKDEAEENAAGFAAMLTGDYHGEIAGMWICAIVAGVRLKDGANAMDVVGRLLDRMNAEHKWHLIPKRSEGRNGVIRLDSTRPGTFKLFPPGQRPAFAGIDNWLIFCTNRKALEKLMTVDKGEMNKWLSGANTGGGIYLAGDLEATGKAVEDAVAAYAMMADIEAGKKNKAVAAGFDLVQAWARIGVALKTGVFRLCVSDSQPEIQFKFSPSHPPPLITDHSPAFALKAPSIFYTVRPFIRYRSGGGIGRHARLRA